MLFKTLSHAALALALCCGPVAANPLPAHPSPGQAASQNASQAMPQAKALRVAQRPKAKRLTKGKASFYGARFAGRKTANGERFNPRAMTMAHRHLPFGTLVRVTNQRNKRSVVVRVNDRGPFVRGRIADLSRGAAVQLAMLHKGVATVTLEVLGQGVDAGQDAATGHS